MGDFTIAILAPLSTAIFWYIFLAIFLRITTTEWIWPLNKLIWRHGKKPYVRYKFQVPAHEIWKALRPPRYRFSPRYAAVYIYKPNMASLRAQSDGFAHYEFWGGLFFGLGLEFWDPDRYAYFKFNAKLGKWEWIGGASVKPNAKRSPYIDYGGKSWTQLDWEALGYTDKTEEKVLW